MENIHKEIKRVKDIINSLYFYYKEDILKEKKMRRKNLKENEEK